MEKLTLAGTLSVYRLHPAVAIEDFGDRSLALHCEDLRLVELNATAKDLLSWLDGQNSLGQVAAAFADHYGQPLEPVLKDVRLVITRLAELGLVERVSSPPK